MSAQASGALVAAGPEDNGSLRQWSHRGLRFDVGTQAAVVEAVEAGWGAGHGGWILTVNTDILRRLERNARFRELVAPATLRVLDGMPLVWAARLVGVVAQERVAGADLLWSLSAAAARKQRRVFLLGGDPGTASRARDALIRQNPSLRIAGIESPPHGFESDPGYLRQLEERVRASQPDLVFVGLGSPKQDTVIALLRNAVPRAWYVGVGIAFSFASGDLQRAPSLAQKLGLEWLHRLAQEPRRLARRYLVDDFVFGARVVGGAFVARLGGTSSASSSGLS